MCHLFIHFALREQMARAEWGRTYLPDHYSSPSNTQLVQTPGYPVSGALGFKILTFGEAVSTRAFPTLSDGTGPSVSLV